MYYCILSPDSIIPSAANTNCSPISLEVPAIQWDTWILCAQSKSLFRIPLLKYGLPYRRIDSNGMAPRVRVKQVLSGATPERSGKRRERERTSVHTWNSRSEFVALRHHDPRQKREHQHNTTVLVARVNVACTTSSESGKVVRQFT